MLAKKYHSRGWLVLFGLLIGIGGSAAQRGYAQQTSDGGYAVSEAGEAQAPDPVPSAGSQENTGPVRLARIAYVQGNVTWRTDENTDWSNATLNLPLRQGAQIWVAEGGRAEIQFDDGSLLRLGTGAVVTLQTLYSDSDGEFTEIKMTAGLAALRLRTDRSVYQVNTPLGSIKAAGPAGLRIGVGNGLELAVQSGKATLEGAQGKADLERGDFVDLANANSPYTVRDIPRPDSWDRWNQERDDLLSHAAEDPANQHLPANVAIVAEDLNSYGTWHDDAQDGWVWCPRVSTNEWRPYHDGQWTWVNPFGWTWVSTEAWGWAPYHYGTWVSKPYGWAWCPGPVNQYWSPAVVHFSECNGQIGWCPLAPGEVRYPASIGFGFRRGNWSTYFSICGAAVYYPTSYGYCAPRVYNTVYVNRVTYVTKVTNINVYGSKASFTRFGLSQESYAANNNTYLSGGAAFIPRNSRIAAGVTAVSANEFGGRGSYVRVAKADTTIFTRGRTFGAPTQGAAPLAGPAVKPTQLALTPTRTFTVAQQAGPAVQNRNVYRASVMPAVARNSAPITSTGKIVTPPQTGYLKPSIGQATLRNGNGTGRTLPTDRTATNTGRNNGFAGQDPGRIPVQSKGNIGQDPNQGQGHVGAAPANGRFNPDKRSNTGDPKGSTSAADAAAAARASLNGGRTRSNGNSSDGNGSVDRTSKTPQYNGANGTGNSGSYDRTPRTPQYNGSNGSGNVDRTGKTPQYNGPNNSGTNGSGSADRTNRPPQYNGSNNPGNGDRTPRTPQYNGSNGSTNPGNGDRTPKTPVYNGQNNSGSNGSSGEKSAPTYTPRQPQYTPPPKNDPPRNDPPRQPQYTPPPKNDPPRSDPPRQQYTPPAPRNDPPARQPDRTPPPQRNDPPAQKDKGSDSKGSDNPKNGRTRG